MKVLVFGSANIDHVYKVAHFVNPGETISSAALAIHNGGKGANQAIACARTGAETFFAGRIGLDGSALKSNLERNGVNTSLLEVDSAAPTGHAIIQVAPNGQNAIIVHGGANFAITSEQIARAISVCEKGDIILLQNEINNLAEIVDAADAAGLRIFFNPSPLPLPPTFSPQLAKVDTFILNEEEYEALKPPRGNILVTLGKNGARLGEITIPGINVEKVLDTTGAGDTFAGTFVGKIVLGSELRAAMIAANEAAARSIRTAGAGSND